MEFRIVSGGQTGVDRAALDAAMAAGIEVGGWCPKGRRAEDGPIAPRYPLRETPTEIFSERTRWNVRDSDATLIVTRGEPTGGTAETIGYANELGRPLLMLDPSDVDAGAELLRQFISGKGIETLNVAGPRESTLPGVYADARRLLEKAFAGMGKRDTR